jgi:hypothetical protein
MRSLLSLLALLPLLPAEAKDLEWHVQVVTASQYAPIEFVAQLRNPTAEKVAFPAKEERPGIVLTLETEGKPPVRKPLPKELAAYKGTAEVEPGQYAWYVSGDLRRAFGRLPPGRYTLRVGAAAAAFEILETSVEEARKNWTAPEGIDLLAKDGKAILVNRRKTPISLYAYGDRADQPLDALTTAQQWTGRAWTRSPGGFCGTGLEEVVIPAGGRREIALLPLPDGILRLSVPCFERKGEEAVAIEALSEPFLVDTFPG